MTKSWTVLIVLAVLLTLLVFMPYQTEAGYCHQLCLKRVWKPNDGTNVMDKHNKACGQQSSPSSQSSIDLYFTKTNNISKKLINSTKRKLILSLAECCALDSLLFTLVRGDGSKELVDVLFKTIGQLSAAISIYDVIPDSTTVN
ncbi:unnamed protein product [Rotaria sp. Silwood1]|nr:unnamed protein product [Rotaria sp. Silwood1]CAF1635105.1 unnamed protein product [Rotaria sp. Silwood1]CAF3789718.1 unnamed protein product [Rotaria sp. Silwood1]CAF3853263.1 unnamed protein product [Rotaria sp. Silwood1]CAF3869659.1 unnamed protein product [Rotaria sp. Silwood1]